MGAARELKSYVLLADKKHSYILGTVVPKIKAHLNTIIPSGGLS